MRKIILAASASAFGLLVAAAPASALSSYTITTDGGNGFAANGITPSENNLTIKATSPDNWQNFGSDAVALDRYNASKVQQQNLSGDMGWQGTGYYLRPDR